MLDTHALLWWQADAPQLGPSTRNLLADRGNDVLVSPVSLWEIVIKVRARKMDVDIGAVETLMAQDGFTLIGVNVAHLRALIPLPTHHRDPFDQMLIAQAIAEDATLVSNDRHVPSYPVRHLACSA